MRKMRMVLLLVVLDMSCQAVMARKKIPKYIRDNFTNCYNHQPTRIRELLNIDGYYSELRIISKPSTNSNSIQKDSNNNVIIFYEDGTFIYNVAINSLYNTSDMSLYLDEVSKSAGKENFYSSGYWGVYKIKNDTLILQYVHRRGSFNDDWFGFEVWYKVLARDSIMLIASMTKPLHHELKQGKGHELYLKKVENKQSILSAKFIRCKNVPPPNSWLKNENWIWCENKID